MASLFLGRFLGRVRFDLIYDPGTLRAQQVRCSNESERTGRSLVFDGGALIGDVFWPPGTREESIPANRRRDLVITADGFLVHPYEVHLSFGG